MDVRTDSFVIVGGGSAGWMTASTFIREFPDRPVTVIESADIPTIGIGEASVPEMNAWIEYLGINWDEFMVEAEASWKLAGKFVDFTAKGTTFYVPTFFTENGRYFNDGAVLGAQDWDFKKLIHPDTDPMDYYSYHFPQYHMIQNNKFTEDLDRSLDPYIPVKHRALHVNAIKFANYLREKYAKPRGVNHITATVKEIIPREDGGIKALVLDNGQIVEGELFIDCTGFKSLLLGGFMKEKFVSTLDYLPHNRAFFAPVEYTDKNVEMDSCTTSFALGNGWAWNTPIWSRIGTGYTWSDEFTDEESALQEFKDHLDSRNMKVYDPERSKKTEIRPVYVKNGYHERSWVKNVVAIGLSSSFIDPLEGSGLFFIFNTALTFARFAKNRVITGIEIDLFNSLLMDLINLYIDFIGLHFILSRRDDTEYWKKWRTRDYHSRIIPKLKESIDNDEWTKYGNTRLAILHGANFPIANNYSFYNNSFNYVSLQQNLKQTLEKRFEEKEAIVEVWQEAIKRMPYSQYEFLKNKYYDR